MGRCAASVGPCDPVRTGWRAARLRPARHPALPRPGRPLLYTRPIYSNDDRLFYDLLSYAPGLNTSLADMRAVIGPGTGLAP